MKQNIFDDPGCENIWKIFVFFKCQIHNEGLPGQNCCFLAFFKTGSKVSACQVSSVSDQPFSFFHRQIKKYTKYLTCFYKEKHLAQNVGNFASSKFFLNIIGSKMNAQ